MVNKIHIDYRKKERENSRHLAALPLIFPPSDAKWRLRNERRNSILVARHYPDLASSSDWLNQISHAARPIRSTTQIWVVARHQYGIFALVSQTSFGRETSGSVSKCRLFSQAKKYSDVPSLVLTILQVFYLITYSIKCIFLNFSPFIVSIHKELGAKILPRGMIWLFPIVCHPLNNMERHARLTVPLVITLAALHLLAAG